MFERGQLKRTEATAKARESRTPWSGEGPPAACPRSSPQHGTSESCLRPGELGGGVLDTKTIKTDSSCPLKLVPTPDSENPSHEGLRY